MPSMPTPGRPPEVGRTLIDMEHLTRRDMTVNDARILALADLPAHAERIHAGGRVVATTGVFDLLHPGHVAYLEAIRSAGQVLVVSVIADARVAVRKGPSRPVLTQAERARMLAALRCVDWVVTEPAANSTEGPFLLCEALHPEVFVLVDAEWDAQRDRFAAAGTELVIADTLPGISTSEIIARISGP